jgi:TPR repeat protein
MWFAALSLFAAMSANLAAQEKTDEEKKYGLVNLLDADKPLAERQAVLDHYKERALDGSSFHQYVVGSLYRVGSLLPGNIVERDIVYARQYLSTAAAHGYINAMAKMAELELAEGRSLEAMIWAQLFGHYITEKDLEKPKTGYFPDLLHRIYAKFDEKQTTNMEGFVNGFIAAHDADIQAGIAAGAARYESSTTKRQLTYMTHESQTAKISGRKNDDWAEYLIAFAPDGSAEKAWMLDAVPDVSLGKELRAVAMRVKVNASTDEPLRYAVVPLAYTYGRYGIRQEK